MTCQTCHNSPFGHETWTAAISYNAVQASSRDGCPSCALLTRASEMVLEKLRVKPDDIEVHFIWRPDAGDPFLSVRLEYGTSTTRQTFDLYVTEGSSVGALIGCQFLFLVPPRPLSPCGLLRLIRSFAGVKPSWPVLRHGRHISSFADSPECMFLAKSWISNCLESHPQCQNVASNILPDRVIYVGGGANPRLIENHSGEITGKYAALSYCWGGHVAMQLKKDNIDAFKQNMGFDDLPKTFQDAITICVALDIQYVWIDALCIIQDSAEDWDIQGSKMAQIYSDCVITIAADTAANTRAGFLTMRSDSLRSSVVRVRSVQAQESGEGPAQDTEVYIRRDRELTYAGGFPHHFFLHPERDEAMENDELQSHLSNRGWCFQESILPTRTLHFAQDEMSWTCRTDSFCECSYGSIIPKKRSFSEQGLVIDRAKLKEDWPNVTSEYTRRSFTFWSDRLVAMAGLAAHVNSQYPHIVYLAGLWSDELSVSLLWSCSQQTRKSERIMPYIAPSWSWASITGQAQLSHPSWYATKDESRLEIVKADSFPAGPNLYGAVEHASLVVKGIVFRVRLLEIYDDGAGFQLVRIVGGNETSDTYDVDGYGNFDVPDEVCVWDESTSDEDGSSEDSSDEGSSAPQVPGEFTMLNVLGYECFLILRKAHREGMQGEFERVGYFNGSNNSGENKASAMNATAQALGEMTQITLV